MKDLNVNPQRNHRLKSAKTVKIGPSPKKKKITGKSSGIQRWKHMKLIRFCTGKGTTNKPKVILQDER